MRWILAALTVTAAIALVEARQRELQSALLLYFLASFWLALPRRAPAPLLLAAQVVAPFAVHLATPAPANWSALATLGALLLGTVAGAAGGNAFRVLDAPSITSGEPPERATSSLEGRVLLPLALTAFAALGVAPIWASLRWGGWALGFIPVPRVNVGLVAVRWAQALTLVAWVLLTPWLVRYRARSHPVAAPGSANAGVTVGEVGRHIAAVAVLLAAHASVLSAASLAAARRADVFVGPGPAPAFAELWYATAAAYAPFDLLTYIAILSLARLADRARQAAEARREAAALEATAVRARLSALRARLDPHFLYNALNAAVTLARRGEGAETSRVLEELTALLRYVLDDRRAWVSLRDELDFVRRYLAIMRLRFGARLSYSVEAGADILDVQVPLLVLQPVVENAVEHGVANAHGPVSVRVAAQRDGGRVVLTVEDDGPGPDAGASVGDGAAGQGIGLGHTRERLAILFGDRAALTLDARAPHGAVARVTFPVAADGPPLPMPDVLPAGRPG